MFLNKINIIGECDIVKLIENCELLEMNNEKIAINEDNYVENIEDILTIIQKSVNKNCVIDVEIIFDIGEEDVYGVAYGQPGRYFVSKNFILLVDASGLFSLISGDLDSSLALKISNLLKQEYEKEYKERLSNLEKIKNLISFKS